jgi:hypothetical protein
MAMKVTDTATFSEVTKLAVDLEELCCNQQLDAFSAAVDPRL